LHDALPISRCVTPSRVRQLEFHRHRDHFHTHIAPSGYSPASATIFWAALFAHSIMEGIGECACFREMQAVAVTVWHCRMATGLGVTSSMQQIANFAAIILHKDLAALAMSISLLEC